MKALYKIFSETLPDESGKPIFIYRILVENGEGKILEILPDIFLDKTLAEEFAKLCNGEKAKYNNFLAF